MRRDATRRARARAFAAVLAGAVALATIPVPALAVTPRRVLIPPAPPVIPRAPTPLATVDHPPADRVGSFDNGPRAFAKVALTFDADMTPTMLQQLRSGQVRSWYNQDVRDVLDTERVPATIFLTGLWAQTYPDVARSLAEDPLFEIGSHTHDHAAFRTPCYGMAPAFDRAAEITVGEREIEQATGLRPTLLRFPGDCYDASDVALAGSLGMTVISGDVRGGDAFNPSAAAIAGNVLRAVEPGSIVILHIHGGPNAPMTAPALRLIVDGVRQRGLAFATVSEVLQRRSPAAEEAPRTRVVAHLRVTRLEAPPAAIRVEWALRAPRPRGLRRPIHVLRTLLEYLIP